MALAAHAAVAGFLALLPRGVTPRRTPILRPARRCGRKVWMARNRVLGSRFSAVSTEGIRLMALILIVLLLALLLGGLGFAVHILWWIALIVLVVWLLGFLIRVGEGGRSRWYRWLPAPRD
jgi:hypothetical protein